MNECFTVPIFEFSELKGKEGERRGAEEEGGAAEGKVSYSVSSGLQIT